MDFNCLNGKSELIMHPLLSLALVIITLLTALCPVAEAANRPAPPNLYPGPLYQPPGLVWGAAFKDRILPMPIYDALEEEGIWGADGVIPRDIHNGIEDPQWSYWCISGFQGEDNRYHMYACRWPSNDPRGHGAWPDSEVVYAIGDKPTGPFIYQHTIGKAHNAEVVRLKDGTYAIFRIGETFYIADKPEGPWKLCDKKITLDHNGMREENVDNPTFTYRKDGSLVMIPRHGGVYISQSGAPEGPYKKVCDRAYPPGYEGRYNHLEDPVVWRGPSQYHLIANYWPTCQAIYMRSLDAVHWIQEPGIAYDTSVTVHEDGTRVNWFKLERPKVLQDKYRRATHLLLAGIDVIKNEDKGGDNHSSKSMSVPLVTERLITILNDQPITSDTKTIRLLVKAEPGFNPHLDMDIKSLRLGAWQEVNWGRGAKVQSTAKQGDDLILEFDAKGHGIMDDNIAAKLLGKTANGGLLYGYAILPGQQQL